MLDTRPEIDPAILKSLSLNPEAATLTSHGSSGFSSTFKLTSKDEDGLENSFFVKIGKGKESEIMFAGTPSPCKAFGEESVIYKEYRRTHVPERDP